MRKNRILAFFLVICLVCSFVGAPAYAEGELMEEESCTQTDGCTLSAGHDEECPGATGDDTGDALAETPVYCTLTEGCTLPDGHEGDCTVLTVIVTDPEELAEAQDSPCEEIPSEEDALPEQQPVYAAELDGIGYSTLEDAMAAASDGTAVTLLEDAVLSRSLVVCGDVTLDLNGHTLSSDLSVFSVPLGSRLTLDGGTLESSQPVINVNGGELILNGGTVRNTGSLEAIHVPCGSVTVNGGSVIGVSNGIGQFKTATGLARITVNGGEISAVRCAVYAENADIRISGGVLSSTGSDLTGSDRGSAVACYSGSVAISGGTFSSSASYALSVSGSTAFNMTGGTVSGYVGFGVFDGNTANIGGSTVCNAQCYGIYIFDGTARVNDGAFISAENAAVAVIGGNLTMDGGELYGRNYGIRTLELPGYTPACPPAINVNGGTVRSAGTYAILSYLGSLSVNGGLVSGTNGIGIDCGVEAQIGGSASVCGTSYGIYIINGSVTVCGSASVSAAYAAGLVSGALSMLSGSLTGGSAGVYISGASDVAVLNISGGSVSGGAGYGVWAKGGTVVVNGGKVFSGKNFGIFLDSAAVGLVCGGEIKGVQVGVYCKGSVTVKGGSLYGESNYALTTYTAGSSAHISGGSFSGGKYSLYNNVSAPGTVSVTGGSFSDDISAYLAEGYRLSRINGSYVPSKAPVSAMVKSSSGDEAVEVSIGEAISLAKEEAVSSGSSAQLVLAPVDTAAASITEIVSAVAESHADIGITVPVSAGKISFNSAAVADIIGKSSEASSAEISVSLEQVSAEAVSQAQLSESAVVVQVSLAGADVSEDTGGFGSLGEATITLPLPAGIDEPIVYYVSGSSMTPVNCTLNGDGTLSFTTNHFSYYAIAQREDVSGDDGNQSSDDGVPLNISLDTEPSGDESAVPDGDSEAQPSSDSAETATISQLQEESADTQDLPDESQSDTGSSHAAAEDVPSAGATLASPIRTLRHVMRTIRSSGPSECASRVSADTVSSISCALIMVIIVLSGAVAGTAAALILIRKKHF